MSKRHPSLIFFFIDPQITTKRIWQSLYTKPKHMDAKLASQFEHQ